MSIFDSLKRIVAEDPAAPKIISAPVPVNQELAKIRPMVAANQNGENVAQIIPVQISQQPRRTNPGLVGNVSLPVVQNDNSAPVAKELVREEIGPDHMLEAPTITPEPEKKAISEPQPSIQVEELPQGVKITGENASVQNFLPEIFELLRVGKELDSLMLQRSVSSEKNVKAKEQVQKALTQAGAIRNSISEFLTSASVEDSREKLSSALKGYEEFLAAFEAESVNKDSFLRAEDNKLIAKINATKSKISGLIKTVGGMENFDKVKSVFKKLNFMREKVGGYAEQIIIQAHDILQEMNNPANSQIFKELSGRNDVVGIFKLMYGINNAQN